MPNGTATRPTTAWLLPTRLRRYTDLTLLLLRVVVGAFLIWGVVDNIFSAQRMHEFENFLAGFGFPMAQFMAPLSVWVQFLVGLAFICGFLVRWAGVLCAINFLVAIIMVDMHGGIRASFPSACLVLIGLHLATVGAGRFGLDRLIESRSDNAGQAM